MQMKEPVLLVGETGVGKTATVSYLAKLTGDGERRGVKLHMKCYKRWQFKEVSLVVHNWC